VTTGVREATTSVFAIDVIRMPDGSLHNATHANGKHAEHDDDRSMLSVDCVDRRRDRGGRRAAVRLVVNSKMTVREAGEAVGASPGSVCGWVKAYKKWVACAPLDP